MAINLSQPKVSVGRSKVAEVVDLAINLSLKYKALWEDFRLQNELYH